MILQWTPKMCFGGHCRRCGRTERCGNENKYMCHFFCEEKSFTANTKSILAFKGIFFSSVDIGSSDRQLGYFLWKTEVGNFSGYQMKDDPTD